MRFSPVARGTLLAVLAAVAFGATTPVVWAAAKIASPFTVATLLYAGAAAGAATGAWGLRRRAASSEPPMRRAHAPRVAAVSLLGACVAPIALGWGLARTGATTGALMLNLEALFTVLLARVVYREPIGGRVALALAATTAAGTALALHEGAGAAGGVLGAIAIAVATLAWAADNTLMRRLADVEPLAVVTAKGAIGAGASVVLALATGARWPPVPLALGVLVAGVLGYGASLLLYLRAQRVLGAGRTGALFAIAPFVGALIAVFVEGKAPTAAHAVAAVLFGLAVWLHATERHMHPHRHAREDHEHAHRHDDGHHDHVHEPALVGEHSHAHRHEPLDHTHDHTPDLHHEHAH